jgi:ketosteroid isomerase-like protein
MFQENVEVVRRFIEAIDAGDREAVAAFLHPQVEWRTMAGPLLGADAMRGRDETVSFIFERIPEGVEDFQATIEHARELSDGLLLVLGHYSGRGATSGAPLEVASASLYRLEAGMIVSFRDFPSEALALEAAGLSE